MNTKWMIKTSGDPIGTVLELIARVWQDNQLESLLVSTNGSGEPNNQPHLIHNLSQLEQVNPFKPLMTTNATKLVPGILRENTSMRWGAILRPCEMRALIEVTKRSGLDLSNLVTICVDCLGTYPADDYDWRIKRIGSAEKLTNETLHFSRQGGIMAYRYRSACQLCTSFEARAGDINIGVIGLPIRQFIFVFSGDLTSAKKLNLEIYATRKAEDNTVNEREKLIAKLIERRQRTHNRVIDGIADILPTNTETLVEHFIGCGQCQACLDECPLCAINFPQRTEGNRYRVEDINYWLISCAGCGMCEQACPQHQPLSAIFGYIRDEINKEIGYAPGLSLNDQIPNFA